MNISKKLTAMLLAIILLIACAVPVAIAAPANKGVSLSGDKTAKTITAQLELPAAGKEASVICMAPSYNYNPSAGMEDWTNYPEKVVGLDQITLDDAGKGTVTVYLDEIESGDYTVLVGAAGSAYYATFAFEAAASAVEAAVSSTSYYVNEEITATVTTPANVTKISLFNENGMKVGAQVVSVQDSESGGKTWTVSFKIGTAGADRKIGVYAYDGANNVVGSTSVQFDILRPAAALTSASTKVKSAPKDTPFDVDVTTNTSVKGLSFTNEKGGNIGKTLVRKLSTSEGIAWTYSIKLGTAGTNRKIFVNLIDYDNNVIEKAGYVTIDITK